MSIIKLCGKVKKSKVGCDPGDHETRYHWGDFAVVLIHVYLKTIKDIDVKLFVMGSLGPKKSFFGKNFLHDMRQENTFKALFRSFEAI